MERSDQRLTAAVWMTILAILATFAGLVSPDGLAMPEIRQTDDENAQLTAARQGGPEADCEGISFEDMFYYDFAEFDVDLRDSWDSADVGAKAFVNGTNGDIVRTDLDELFDGFPGGNNGWLSTDERDGVETIGKDCVAQTYTRIGLRDGPSHRGGQGVDWNNLTWVKDGMVLAEWNLLPEEHPERRNCVDQFGAPAGSPSCEEVPVVPENTCGISTCSIIIWLNSSVEFDVLNNPSNFTLAVIGTNLSDAMFSFTFPEIPDSTIRVSDTYEEKDCNRTYTEDDDEADDYGVTYVTREECLSYIEEGTREYTMRTVDGGTEFSTHFTYVMNDWPALKMYFFDFTTAPPLVDNPPTWTSIAPAEGDLLGVTAASVTQTVLGPYHVAGWFSDEMGAGLLDVDCTGGAGWVLAEAGANDWTVTPPESGGQTSITCEAIDSAGQSSGTRNFVVASPFTVSVTEASPLDSAVLTLTSTDNTPNNMQVNVELEQYGISVSGSTVLGVDSTGTISIDLGILSPGPISVQITATGDGMAPMSQPYDLGLSKASIPPVVSITGNEWLEDVNFILLGYFSDADGEAVSFTLSLDGVQMGQIIVTGNQWQTQEIQFDTMTEGIHTVTVEGCDSSGQCTSVSEDVDNTFLFEEEQTIPDSPTSTSDDDDGGLPAPGLGITVMALLGAGLLARRRRE